MHIVKFQGGLGNQMFQYALYREFQHLGYDTYADLYPFSDEGYEKRSFDLHKFGIRLREADKKDIIRLYGDVNSYVDRIRLRFFGKKTYYNEKKITFKPEILTAKEGYFNGYWQSEKYFADIREILIQEFQFPEITDNKNARIQEKIKADASSVGIHVRLGDYLNVQKVYGGICTKEYYEKAMDYMRERIGKPHFYIFSNDIALAREQFAGDEYIYVNNNSELQGYIDMQLMSMCRHQIIANSSFSWWGAWLNQNHEKIVVAPAKWFRKCKVKDIWCDGWKVMESGNERDTDSEYYHTCV